eukprot:scaffold10248_cov65-Phaeocystis_antarctica.AAC.2
MPRGPSWSEPRAPCGAPARSASTATRPPSWFRGTRAPAPPASCAPHPAAAATQRAAAVTQRAAAAPPSSPLPCPRGASCRS